MMATSNRARQIVRILRTPRVSPSRACFCGEAAVFRVRVRMLAGGKRSLAICKTCGDCAGRSPIPDRWRYGLRSEADFFDYLTTIRADSAAKALAHD